MRLHSLLPLALLAAGAAACDDANVVQPSSPAGFATLQIVNAVTTIDTIGLHLDGAQFPVNFARARNTSGSTAGNACVNIPAGQHTVSVRALRTSTDLATLQHDFAGGQRYTLVFAGTAAAPRLAVLTDTFTPPDTAVHVLVRFINASSTAGDVYATPAGASLAGVQPVVANLAPVGAPTPDVAWTTVPRANTQVRFFNTGTTTGTPRATLNLTGLPANRVTNVVFFNAPPPAGATVLRFNPCT